MNESYEQQMKNFNDIADLQDELLDIDFNDKSELNSFKEKLLLSPLLNSKWTFRSVLVSIYTCFLCRPHSDFNYIDLFIEVAKLPQNIFSSDDYILNFTNKFFIYQLYKVGLVKINSIYSQSLNDESYLTYFYPEIKEQYNESPTYYKYSFSLIKKSIDSLGYKFTDTDEKSYLEKFTELRSNGKNPDPIALAIRDDDIERLQNLLYQTNTLPNQVVHKSIFERFVFINIQSLTLIEFAAFFGSIQCFKFLYNQISELPETVATFAAAGGNYDIIHLCEKREIDFNHESLVVSIRFFRSELSTYFEENFNIKKSMDEVSKSIIYYNLRSLIDCEEVIRADPNKLDSNGYNILSLASINGDLDVIHYLIETYGEKIDLNGKTNYGNSPFYFASGYGHFEIVKYLASLPNTDVNAKNQDGLTALHFAAQRGQLKVVKFLCDLPNIEINAICSNDKHPIDYAAENGHIEIMRFLSGLPNIVIYDANARGNSILESCVMSERLDVVKFVFDMVFHLFDNMENKEEYLKNDVILKNHIYNSFLAACFLKANDIMFFIHQELEKLSIPINLK